MTIRTLFAILTLAAVNPLRAAQHAPDDDLTKAYDAALADLRAGKDRREIADRLKLVVEKNPRSYFFRVANEFLTDLTASAKNSPKPDAAPELRLADTRITFGLLRASRSLEGALTEELKKSPGDPVGTLLARDRSVIAVLLPLLEDRSPTRSVANGLVRAIGERQPQPRVGDVALALIEHHSRCRFRSPHYPQFRDYPKAELAKVVNRIREWWAENKEKSVAAGVRAHFPHLEGETYKIEMATTLVQLGEGQKTDDKEFGLSVLRGMVKDNRQGSLQASAAEALAEFRDTSAVDLFHAEWKEKLGKPGATYDTWVASFLCKHGQRREWELLYAVSVRELDGPDGAGGGVWAAAMHDGASNRQPYVIPILGRALKQTATAYLRSDAKGKAQPYSFADDACEYLQHLTSQDFGYQSDGTAAERQAAIKKANKWWEDEGRAKYTFDYIEKNMRPAKKPGK